MGVSKRSNDFVDKSDNTKSSVIKNISKKIIKNSLIKNSFHLLSQIPETVMNHLRKLVPQLRLELPAMIDMLKTLADIVTDVDFVQQSLAINDVIAVLSADN